MTTKTKQDILYFPIYLFLHGVALLPFWVLYRIADFIYFLLYYVIRYRKRVVRKNIAESFPEKSAAEQRTIIKEFYLHLSDYFVETIKLLHISDEEMKKRMVFENMELVDEQFDKGRSIVMYAGHYGNWEYLTSITLWGRHSSNDVVFAQIYRPLKNEWFDNFFLNLRARFHSVGIPIHSTFRRLIQIKKSGKLSITGFISDQHPSGNDSDHIIRFLNHDTAFITGSETLARKLDFDAMYFDVTRPRRGYYKATIYKISFNPALESPMAITDRYVQLLEKSIRTNPSLWLWTHKRWKHKCNSPAVEFTPLRDHE